MYCNLHYIGLPSCKTQRTIFRNTAQFLDPRVGTLLAVPLSRPSPRGSGWIPSRMTARFRTMSPRMANGHRRGPLHDVDG